MPQRLTLLWGKRTNMSAGARVGALDFTACDACDVVLMCVMLLAAAAVGW